MAEVIVPAWLPEGLYQQWLIAYTEAGGPNVSGSRNYATELLRASPEYDSYFPGLRRDDGSLRYDVNPERTYYDNINSFRKAATNSTPSMTGMFRSSSRISKGACLYSRIASSGSWVAVMFVNPEVSSNF